jgi:hypothetical protein
MFNDCSVRTSHFGLHNQLAKPSSLTWTTPLRTTCELPEGRLGEPPIPEYEGAYEDPEGEDEVKEKDELYPDEESVLLLYIGDLWAMVSLTE